jgi:hypothetical protein
MDDIRHDVQRIAKKRGREKNDPNVKSKGNGKQINTTKTRPTRTTTKCKQRESVKVKGGKQ